MTTVQRVARIVGAGFLLIGILGFIPQAGGTMTMEPDYLLGLFAVNALHNVVHILFGVWGLVAAGSFGGAKTYAVVGGVLYLALAVLGVFVKNVMGFLPIGGNDVFLHAALGLVLAAAGFTARDTTRTVTV
jgi:hypothetical protein